ncbi:MAG TPA: tetratricopeptide repeat protein [Burkholderiales bacterium]|nr:tetratricopeptide repeat protein [Burkholderiales bacterium]
MSLINKMLRDIDQRTAGSLESPAIAQAQHPVEEPPPRRTLLFAVAGIAVVLVLGAAGWGAWRLKPSKLMSEAAFQQAAEAQKQKSPQPPPPAVPATAVAPAPASPPAPPQPAAEAAPPAAAGSTTPASRPESARSENAPKVRALPRTVAAKPAPDPAKIAAQQADKQFAHAVRLLGDGRVSEAEAALGAAIQADPTHVAARQAYAALLLEQGRTDAAKGVLYDALKRDPSQPMFALALARIDAQQRNFAAALDVMDQAGPAAAMPDFQALRGAVYQRMGRHAEAVEAYRNALATDSQPAQAWVSFAISLEALGRRAEAAQAYRRGMAGGALPREVRDYAEARLRAVD